MARTNAAPARARFAITRENFTSGGICPEGDYLVVSASYELFQYATKDGTPTGNTTTAFHLKLQPVNAQQQADGQEIDQYYSVGDPANYAPSEDGDFLEVVGTKTSLSSQSNFFIAYDNLCNAGMPEGLLNDNGASSLNGMIGHIAHIPAPERNNIQRQSAVGTGALAQAQAPKDNRPKTIPVFKTILTAPWDKNKKAAKPAATAAKATAKPVAAPVAAAEPDGDGDAQLTTFIRKVVTANNNSINRTTCRMKVHREYNQAKIDAAVRDAAMTAFDDDTQLATLLGTINCMIDDTNIVDVDA